MSIRHHLRQLHDSLSRNRAARNPRKRTHQLTLEHLETRLAPAEYFWQGNFGSLWSWPQNWYCPSLGCSRHPYEDPSAHVIFEGELPLDTEHDSTSPTTMELIAFRSGGYSLSPRLGAGVITLTGGILSATDGGTSTISLPLDFGFRSHEFQVNGSDTLILSGDGNLRGGGIIQKV